MAHNIGKTRQVFWDDFIVDTEKTSATPCVNRPVEKECCFTFDEKDEMNSISYPCVVKDEHGYKMYYQPWGEDLKPSVRVIESEDGVHWSKPHLDIFDLPGMKENNVVIDRVKDGIFVFYDTCVVYKHVDLSVLLADVTEHLLNFRKFGYVCLVCSGFASKTFDDALNFVCCIFIRIVVDDYRIAFLSECYGTCSSDTAACAGHKSNFLFVIHIFPLYF